MKLSQLIHEFRTPKHLIQPKGPFLVHKYQVAHPSKGVPFRWWWWSCLTLGCFTTVWVCHRHQEKCFTGFYEDIARLKKCHTSCTIAIRNRRIWTTLFTTTNRWDQWLAGGLICRRDVEDLRQRKHRQNWWPKKATFAHFMYWIHFIHVMNLCACVSQVYIIALMSYLPSCMISWLNIQSSAWNPQKVTRFPGNFRTQASSSRFRTPLESKSKATSICGTSEVEMMGDLIITGDWPLSKCGSPVFLDITKKMGPILSLQMPAYKVMRNPNLPQSLPILFHSFYPLESVTSSRSPTTLPKPQTTVRYVSG